MKTKHYLFGALAAMMLMTSCQDDTALMGNEGETAMVSFQLETPAIATRAYSDGTTATVLQYAVYDAQGNELTDLTKSVEKGNAETINISKTVNLQLTTGNTYTVIFWAAAPDAPYTVDFENKTMTVDYEGALSNDENRDAFYNKIQEITVRGTQSETVELRRPFAQLNIGTSDYAASTSAGYTPKYSSVMVKGLGNTLNLWDGTVNDAKEEITFGFNAIPEASAETFPVAGYEYLAMNYLLVPAEKEVVDIEFYYGENQAAEHTRTVGSVPVQRNHRTNIYGQLLTSDVDITVEIKPAYDGEYNTLDILNDVLVNGGKLTLFSDITLDESFTVPAGKSVNIDLGGNTLTVSNGATVQGELNITNGTIVTNLSGRGHAFETKGANAVVNLKDVTMTVTGNNNGVTIESLATNPNAAAVINLDNTTIDVIGNNGHAIFVVQYVKNLEINVTNNSHINGKQAIFIENADNAVVNIDATSSVEKVIGVYGNVIVVCDAANQPKTEGGANFTIYSAGEYPIADAFANGGTVTLEEDMEMNNSMTVAAGVAATINLDGNTLDVNSSNTVNGTLTIEGGDVNVNVGANELAFVADNGSVVNIEDANITVTNNSTAVAIFNNDYNYANIESTVNVSNSTLDATNGRGIYAPFGAKYVEINVANSTIKGNNSIFLSNVQEAVITVDENSHIDNIVLDGTKATINYKGTKPNVTGDLSNVTFVAL